MTPVAASRPRHGAKPLDDFEWPPTADELSVYELGPDPWQKLQDASSQVFVARRREASQRRLIRVVERAPQPPRKYWTRTRALVLAASGAGRGDSRRMRSLYRPVTRPAARQRHPPSGPPPPTSRRHRHRRRSRSSRPTRSSRLPRARHSWTTRRVPPPTLPARRRHRTPIQAGQIATVDPPRPAANDGRASPTPRRRQDVLSAVDPGARPPDGILDARRRGARRARHRPRPSLTRPASGRRPPPASDSVRGPTTQECL